MGWREGELHPEASPLEGFDHDLCELRRKADVASYRELARRAHYSASALSTAANGRSLPTLAAVEAYVRPCGGTRPHSAEWNVNRTGFVPHTLFRLTARSEAR